MEKYFEGLVHFQDDSTACDSEFLEVVSNGLQEDAPTILQTEISIENSIAEVMLWRVLEVPHSVILILSGKCRNCLVSSPSARDDQWISTLQQVVVPSVSFEAHFQEASAVLA